MDGYNIFKNSSKGKTLITSKKEHKWQTCNIQNFLKKGYNLRTLLASLLLFCPLKKICANAPEKKGPTPLCLNHLFGVYGGEEQTMQSVPARQSATGPVHWTPHVHKLRCLGIKKTKIMSAWTKKQNKKKTPKKKGWTGFIFWRVMWGRSQCRGRCRSRSSCWRFAAGGGRSVVMMPDRLQRGRLPAMFRSSGLFAGGLCCLSHAKPFSQAMHCPWGYLCHQRSR